MAGVKGKSGGPRPNSGGARPGAGRKPKEPAILTLAATYDDPAKFLRAVMNDSGSESKLRVDAAKALMPFVHPRKGEGKGGDAADKLNAAKAGKFGVRSGPRLVASK